MRFRKHLVKCLLHTFYDLCLHAHLAAISLPLPNRMWAENKMEKPMGWDKDRAITYHLLLWAKWTWLGKLNFIHCQIKQDLIVRKKYKWKQRLLPTLLFFAGSLSLLLSLLLTPSRYQTVQGGWRMGGCGQSISSSSLPLLHPHFFPAPV